MSSARWISEWSASGWMQGDQMPVMAGLDPAIHVFLGLSEAKTWMPGTRPGMTTSYNELSNKKDGYAGQARV